MMSGNTITFIVALSLLSIGAGAAFGDFAFKSYRRKKLAIAVSANTSKEKLVALIKGGVRPFIPISNWMIEQSHLISEAAESATILFSEAGIQVAEVALLSDLIAITLVSFILGTLFGGSPVFGIAIACLVFIGSLSVAKNRFAKRNISMREEIPDTLRTLAMSFRSGHSLPQVLSDSSHECKGYLSHLFSVASNRIEMGATPQEALSIMKGNSRVPELSFVAVALDIQHQSGGGIALVLESAMDSIEGELKLARSLRVQTAQAKLSASVVTIMPFVLIALFSLFSPDFLSPFFSSTAGIAILATALVMQLTGVLIVRKMLNVGGD